MLPHRTFGALGTWSTRRDIWVPNGQHKEPVLPSFCPCRHLRVPCWSPLPSPTPTREVRTDLPGSGGYGGRGTAGTAPDESRPDAPSVRRGALLDVWGS